MPETSSLTIAETKIQVGLDRTYHGPRTAIEQVRVLVKEIEVDEEGNPILDKTTGLPITKEREEIRDQEVTIDPESKFRAVQVPVVKFAKETQKHIFVSPHLGSDCELKVDSVATTVGDVWFRADLPGIMGVKATRHNKGAPYPVAEESDLLKADLEVAKKYMEGADDDASPAELMQRYLARHYGAANIRSKTSLDSYEPSAEVDDSKTVVTISPSHQKYYAFWTPAVGIRLLEELKWWSGHHRFNEVNFDSVMVYYETSVKPGHRKAMKRLAGDMDTMEEQIEWSAQNQTVYVRIPFTTIFGKDDFTTQFNNSAGAYAPLSFALKLANLSNLIVRKNKHTRVVLCSNPDREPDANSISNVGLEIEHVYAHPTERAYFESLSEYEFLMRQYTIRRCRERFNEINIRYPFPTSSIYWMYRREAAAKSNDWFSYAGIFGKSPMQSAMITSSISPRISEKDWRFWHVVTNVRARHYCVPERFIFAHHSTINVNNVKQVVGVTNTLNFSNYTLSTTLQPDLESEPVECVTVEVHFMYYCYDKQVGGLMLVA